MEDWELRWSSWHGDEVPEIGALQPGEEKAAGRPYSGLSVLKGGLQERWGQSFWKSLL